MEQIRKFLRDKGFALALLACLVAAAAAGVWAVRTVRDADRTRRKQCKQCAQGGLLGIAECVFGLLCAAGWLWLGARTIRAARCILACQQFGSACFHAAGLWQGAQWIQRR